MGTVSAFDLIDLYRVATAIQTGADSFYGKWHLQRDQMCWKNQKQTMILWTWLNLRKINNKFGDYNQGLEMIALFPVFTSIGATTVFLWTHLSFERPVIFLSSFYFASLVIFLASIIIIVSSNLLNLPLNAAISSSFLDILLIPWILSVILDWTRACCSS